MRDSDMIEKIRKIYDVKEPDVISRLDFANVDMAPSPEKKPHKRYVYAAVAYAAACLVVLAILPFIMGGRDDGSKPAPANSDTDTETVVTGDDDIRDEKYPVLEVNIDDSVPAEYHDVLIRYRSAIEAVVTGNITDIDGLMGSPYEPVHTLTAGMCEAASAMEDPSAEKYGYSLKDMNGDGKPELLLITENHVLLEIYTVIDGKAQMVEYFWPRQSGIVMGGGQLYTYGSSGAMDYSYTLRLLDDNGELVLRREIGSETAEGTAQYYRIENGAKETVSEDTYLRLKKEYPDIPAFGGEDNEMPYELEYHPIVRTMREWIMEAIERGVTEGRIPDRDYDRTDIDIVGGGRIAYDGMCAFDFGSIGSSFVYSDGEVYPIGGDIPVYKSYRTQICDIDKNGKDDLLIYGSGGSGLSLYSLMHFDSETKELTDLFGGAFVNITVVHEAGDDGEMQYSIYAGHTKEDGAFAGTFEYEDGKITAKLIYEGTLHDVLWEMMYGKTDGPDAPKDDPSGGDKTDPPASSGGTSDNDMLPGNYSKYDARRITAKHSGIKSVVGFTCDEYYDGRCPMYRISFWAFLTDNNKEVYSNRYDYIFNANTGEIVSEECTEKDNTYKDNLYETYNPQSAIPYGHCNFSGGDIYNVCKAVNKSLMKIENRVELLELMDTVNGKVKYSEEMNGTVYRFMDCLDSYDDEFFRENVMYIHFSIQDSGSVYYGFNGISIDGNGVLNFSFREYRPNIIDCLMSGDVWMFTFDRDDLAGVKTAKVNVMTGNELDDPEDITPEVTKKVYADPADCTRIRFFSDKYMTNEYKSTKDIPYGSKVYYLMDNDPGYIITNFKINIYESCFEVGFIPNGGCGDPVDYFVNNYHGDKLEYSYTAVLAGDADGNLYYDENDVNTLRKYLDNDAETRYYYGRYGYSEKLDYDCNGYVNNDDLVGLLAEIETGKAERNTMSRYNYGRVGSTTALLKFNTALILPHGRSASKIEYDYSVHKKYKETSGMSLDIRNKYNDPNFYNENDLIVIYCYTEDGVKPELDELSRIWCTRGHAFEYLTPEYSDNNAGQKLSKYAIVLEIPNDKYLSTPGPS